MVLLFHGSGASAISALLHACTVETVMSSALLLPPSHPYEKKRQLVSDLPYLNCGCIRTIGIFYLDFENEVFIFCCEPRDRVSCRGAVIGRENRVVGV